MKKILYLMLFFITFINVSCSPTLQQHNQTEIQKAREYWIGESTNTLVLSWGAPYSKSNDGNGGKIYTYRRGNGYITWVTDFFINSENVIYHLNAHSE